MQKGCIFVQASLHNPEILQVTSELDHCRRAQSPRITNFTNFNVDPS
jgi:hypothetical protein